jgi:hypothetical protein
MGQARDEIGLADAIRAAREARPAIVATGRCLFCDELVPDDHRWCQDSNCMDLWERERRMKYERV